MPLLLALVTLAGCFGSTTETLTETVTVQQQVTVTQTAAPEVPEQPTEHAWVLDLVNRSSRLSSILLLYTTQGSDAIDDRDYDHAIWASQRAISYASAFNNDTLANQPPTPATSVLWNLTLAWSQAYSALHAEIIDCATMLAGRGGGPCTIEDAQRAWNRSSVDMQAEAHRWT